ncbi:hypothetical protein DLAC_06625 [Tieghemostelium lacteum]|uniref:Uncharacterized protein n=1 Tax=Tieghemostelium lacteum TaxID=361077 RepID=A0A151ZFD9_TIELA|nr:hypothetical protein DLAC_06625 [Tieghemostelium lacteum]|eukprot:KYQ92629.1 hypothetical protein DLAC_06625 [Tieghemostelium lacteum]
MHNTNNIISNNDNSVELYQSFTKAANGIAMLYKNSLTAQTQSYQKGYIDSLDNLQAFIESNNIDSQSTIIEYIKNEKLRLSSNHSNNNNNNQQQQQQPETLNIISPESVHNNNNNNNNNIINSNHNTPLTTSSSFTNYIINRNNNHNNITNREANDSKLNQKKRVLENNYLLMNYHEPLPMPIEVDIDTTNIHQNNIKKSKSSL